ncbi:MAG: serine/threonine protein kinase [Actinomycetota bacterium]|nr:serine/threonine protein kinase [Actinomycetota bacterium]
MNGERERIAQALPAYVVTEVLGRGAFGVVWAGEHRRVGRRVAIKQLTAIDARMRGRFLAEAQVLASLEHPHVVPLYDYVEDGDSCLLVMERLEGGTLGQRFALPRKVGVASACAVAMVTCAGLHHAHRHGVLHRDIKPENLLFSGEGILKVTDFGIAKLVGDGAPTGGSTEIGVLKGTPAYMAPEQVAGQSLGPGVDIYATGLLLHELLSGELPFSEEGSPLVVAFRRLHQDPQRLDPNDSDVPSELADVVMRALSRVPADRFTTAEDFGVAIGRAASASLGPGWLDHSRVALLAPGPIMDSAHVARAHGGAGPPQGSTVNDLAGAAYAPPQPSPANVPPPPPLIAAPDPVRQDVVSPGVTGPGVSGPGVSGPDVTRPDWPAAGFPPPGFPAPGFPAPGFPAPAGTPGANQAGANQAGPVDRTSEMAPPPCTAPAPFPPGWGPPPPPQAPPGQKPKSSAILIAALIAAVVVVAGVAVAIVATRGGGGSVATSVPPTGVATGTTVAPTTTPPTSAGVSAARAAATQLAGLLQQSNGARNLVVTATQSVGACQADPRNGIAQVQTAISERDAVIHNLGAVPLVALPNGSQMIAALNTGLQASIEADRHYIDWMTDMLNTGSCPITDGALQSASTASQQATAAKQTFVSLWNPIAVQNGLTQYAEKDL